MTIIELQGLIGARPDGVWGEKSKAALLARFANRAAPAITPADVAAVASRAVPSPPGAALMPMAAPSACSSGTSSTASPAGGSRPARSASHPPGAIRSMPMATASTTTGTS
jgi:hypothetical protein